MTTLLSKGNLSARVARRINGLLLLNQGLTLQAVAEQLVSFIKLSGCGVINIKPTG
ncbi:MAG: hypothetical protein R2747_17305 [Pyrinomonadaceae bacterium]